MVLTDYYKFTKTTIKAKTRIDCVLSTKSHPTFEGMRSKKTIKPNAKTDGCLIGSLFVYYADVPEPFKADIKRKADKALTKSQSISSIYRPDPTNNYGYGDIKNTTDALLFVLTDTECINGIVNQGASIEVFIARGMAKDKLNLYNLLCDGEFDDEMQTLRDSAQDE